MPHSFVPYSH